MHSNIHNDMCIYRYKLRGGGLKRHMGLHEEPWSVLSIAYYLFLWMKICLKNWLETIFLLWFSYRYLHLGHASLSLHILYSLTVYGWSLSATATWVREKPNKDFTQRSLTNKPSPVILKLVFWAFHEKTCIKPRKQKNETRQKDRLSVVGAPPELN